MADKFYKANTHCSFTVCTGIIISWLCLLSHTNNKNMFENKDLQLKMSFTILLTALLSNVHCPIFLSIIGHIKLNQRARPGRDPGSCWPVPGSPPRSTW